MRKVEKSENVKVEVSEDFRLPGTNIIVEKGEIVEILTKVEELTTDQNIRARYEELTREEGLAPAAAVATIVDEYPIPYDVILPMLTEWGYFIGPMDRR